ncbi:hypothetical protein LTSEHVI_3839, partial [Salmonella enterica subsp. enterica serovar Hvittingfoss str. A4-620]
MDVGYVRYPTFIGSIRIKLPLESVRCHDTVFTFACPRAPVSDLSLYAGPLHQPPDTVHPTLLPGVTQIEVDLAIT